MTLKASAVAIALSSVSTSAVLAGGLDRTGQPIGVLFEEGRYVELSFGGVFPDVSGTDVALQPTGNVGNAYFVGGAAYKADLTDSISYALIVDQPYGASVEYGATTPVFAGTSAEASTVAVTAIGQYNFNENFSVYGGVRAQQIKAEVGLSGAAYGPLSGYEFEGESDWGVGYVVGAAYERKDIALRVALTYSSEIDHSLPTTETLAGGGAVPGSGADTEVTSPQSVNLDFQTGIMADTLLFGSIRWVNWDGFSVAPVGLGTVSPGSTLVTYEDNTFTYNLGIGRRFTENFSAAVQVGYEENLGGTVSALGPTNGFLSFGVGGTYTMNNGLELTGGLRYIMPGDATVASGGGTAEFEDNNAIAAGLKIAYRF
ncbi:OmpP1/FadL family transporter [Algicella marina]|uniref:Transporter n=1 Tax=Algicella marina TaxID=2683284 RepID=A0A6P1SYX9_9RHOB|nr:outer membrane protein transport protein [Algicella marina]QHQ34947.1 hypothetical protein GO499_06920 [Algicella marina]